MIRKTTNGDISNEEFEAILKPFIDDYDNFVISYIMPEVIAYPSFVLTLIKKVHFLPKIGFSFYIVYEIINT